MTSQQILLIDDHAMFRSGLQLLIHMSMPNARVIEAGSLSEALRIEDACPSVVLLDIKMPGLNGVEGITLVDRKWPKVPILILSSQDEPDMVHKAMSQGATGFVSKAESAEHILKMIDLAIHDQLARQALPVSPPQNHLTNRQREVLELLCQGLSNKLIARRLELSDNTVRRHVQDILEYFQVASRAEAVFAARTQGLIQ